MRSNLPHNWIVKKSTDYCFRVTDGTHGTPKPVNEGKLLITSKNIKGGSVNFDNAYLISQNYFNDINKRSKVDQWDVLFSMIGTVGEIALIRSNPDYAIKNIGLFKNKSKFDGIWLYYYLTSSIGQAALDTYLSGTSQQFVALGDLRKIPIVEPPDRSKKKIAAILSAYDDLIENNKRRIALLEKMAEEIYREWFVRMRFPGHEKVRFEKGVPEGWQQNPSTEILDILSGGTPKTDVPAFWDGDIPFFTPKDAPENFYVLKTEKTITSKGLNTCNSRLYKKDTIFITARGTVGKLALAHRDMAMNQSCYALIPKSGNNIFFYFFALRNAISYVKGVSKSGVFDNIIVDTFKIIPIIIPQENLIIDFNNKIEPFMKATGTFLKANELLAVTRDKLLSRLISGKLSVENLDIQFPPSMIELTSFDEHAKPKRALLDVLNDIKIDAPEDFSENLDAYLNGEKHI